MTIYCVLFLCLLVPMLHLSIGQHPTKIPFFQQHLHHELFIILLHLDLKWLVDTNVKNLKLACTSSKYKIYLCATILN